MVKVSDGVVDDVDDFWLTMEKQYFPCVFMPTALSGYKQLLLRKLFIRCGLACSHILWSRVDESFFILTGLFNIGNRLLVSIDLFLKIRASIKLGQSPSQAAKTIVDHVPSHPGKILYYTQHLLLLLLCNGLHF